MATQSFVSQGNFADTEMAVRSGAPTADFTRCLQVTAVAGHAKCTSGVQQKTIQQSIQQSILHTIAPDNFSSNNSIKNEGILICYSRGSKV